MFVRAFFRTEYKIYVRIALDTIRRGYVVVSRDLLLLSRLFEDRAREVIRNHHNAYER